MERKRSKEGKGRKEEGGGGMGKQRAAGGQGTGWRSIGNGSHVRPGAATGRGAQDEQGGGATP